MQLKVTTNDGRKGILTTPVLEANAFKPVEVRFEDGASKRYFLRDLQIAHEAAANRARPRSTRP